MVLQYRLQVDISLDNVRYYKINNQNPDENNAERKKKFEEIKAKDISNQRNKDMVTYREIDSKLSDFYTSYDEFVTTEKQLEKFKNFQEKLGDKEKEILDENKHYYEIKFKNIGGLIMPIFLDFTLKNNSHKLVKIPAEIWMKNNSQVTKVFDIKKLSKLN